MVVASVHGRADFGRGAVFPARSRAVGAIGLQLAALAIRLRQPGAPAWPKLLSLLIPYNQTWAGGAAALVFVVSKATFTPTGKTEPTVSRSASFDTGAAWASLAIQAHLDGWVAHGMGGFDDAAARVALNVPADHRIEAAVAVGRRGDRALLPERYHAGEAPNNRRPLRESVFEGALPDAS